jgi:hypothetical protein
MVSNLSQTTIPDKAVIIIRAMVGAAFLSEGIQKFLFAAQLGAGRFAKLGIPHPGFFGTFCRSYGNHVRNSFDPRLLAEVGGPPPPRRCRRRNCDDKMAGTPRTGLLADGTRRSRRLLHALGAHLSPNQGSGCFSQEQTRRLSACLEPRSTPRYGPLRSSSTGALHWP